MLCTSTELKYFSKKEKEIIWLEVCLLALFLFCFVFESWPYCFFGSWPKKFCFIDLCVGCWDINSLNCQQWNCSHKYESYICGIWFRCGKGGGGERLRRLYFSPENTAILLYFLLNASLWKPRDWAFNARKLCKSLSSLTVHASFSKIFCLMKRRFVKSSGAVVQFDPWFMCGICWVVLKAKFSCWCCKVTLLLLS